MDEQGENNTGLPAVEESAVAAFPEAGVLRMNPLGFVVLAPGGNLLSLPGGRRRDNAAPFRSIRYER